MIEGVRYGHTNVIAKDWRALARFYQDVLGCVPVPPERHYRGGDLERGTGVPGAEVRGVHLRLPGYGPGGPTLEIFTYTTLAERFATAVNRPGFGHLAFMVDDVSAARDEVLASGGRAIGDIVTLTAPNGARVTWTYLADPEGNVIELQTWST
jgi:catechol 2,3-dioxygenase-like lactoylglutathione lyase family enzyme